MYQAHHHTIEPIPLNNLRSKVGGTPLFHLRSFSRPGINIFAKLEWEQFGGSVKARAAAEMIHRDLVRQPFQTGQRFLEATSGNTGIALAKICQVIGHPITIVLPKNASAKRIEILQQAEAELIFSSPLEGTDGSQEVARKMYESAPDVYRYLDQYNNEGNFMAHFQTTGPEIWEQTNGQLTHFVAGLGTSGSFTGTSRYLKGRAASIETVALHPDSPMHGLEGWKHMETAKVPGIYNPDGADRNLEIPTEEALFLVREVYEKEGLWISPSAAANLAGALTVSRGLEQATIVTLFADDGSKYLENFNPFKA